jgi:hypothetical protein
VLFIFIFDNLVYDLANCLWLKSSDVEVKYYGDGREK